MVGIERGHARLAIIALALVLPLARAQAATISVRICNFDGSVCSVPDANGASGMNLVDVGGNPITTSAPGEMKVAVEGLGSAGSPSGGVVSVQGVAGGTPLPVSVSVMNITQVAGNNVATQSAGEMLVGVEGRAASGAAKSGNPVQAGAVFNTTQPTVTTGQVVEAQATARGGLIVATGVDSFNISVNTALPTGANTIGAVTQASGPWTVNVTQVGGNAITTSAAGEQKIAAEGLGSAGSPSGGVVTVQGAVGMTSVIVSQATAANLNVTAAQGGTWTVQQGTTPGSNAGAWWVQVGDTTNGPVAVKAASTAAAAADKSFVVALSPNSPLPTGSNVIGALTANQSVNVAQVGGSNVTTSAAGEQKIAAEGLGSAGTPAGGVLSVQGVSGGTPLPITPGTTTITSASTPASCISVTTASTQLLASNAARRLATMAALTSNTARVRFRFGATAVTTDLPLDAGLSFTLDGAGGAIYTGVINAISESGTQTICVAEY